MKKIIKILFIFVLILFALKVASFYLPVFLKSAFNVTYIEPRTILEVNVSLVRKNIVFDLVHDELNSPFTDYSKFAGLYKSAGANVTFLDSKITNLKNVNVLILTTPIKEFDEQEISTIKKAVEGGMTLILIGERFSHDLFNKISFEFGITFSDDMIYDIRNYTIIYKNPLINEFANITLTKDLKEIAVYDACSLDTFGSAQKLAYSKSAQSLPEKKGDIIVAAVSSLGGGKIFALCDSDMFSNSQIENYDNLIFARNLIEWS